VEQGALGEPGPSAHLAGTGAGRSVSEALNEAPTSKFHRRAVVASGVGFFTDAYDLFVISTVATLVTAQWHLGTAETSWVTGAAILGAFVGAFTFGRAADLLGRKRVYVLVAAIMILGALASAAAPSFAWLVAARFVLGLGIGGDYPVSAVLMSEYSNRQDRGRMVGLVFSMQAVGLVVGPLVGLVLLSSGLTDATVWRLLLGFGAVPAAAVIYLRTRMPESPRYQEHVKGAAHVAAQEVAAFSGGVLQAAAAEDLAPAPPHRLSLRDFVTSRRILLLVLGTAGSWFLFDYAYYGNTLSLPAILKGVDPTATLEAKLVWTLAIFVVFAVPGYILAFMRMDRVGHRRLQLIGFAVMAVAFVSLAVFAPLTVHVAPFLAVFGLSYFFVQFGPNTTTFVLPSEVFPVSVRTTGHGVAAGVGKLGAFIGVFLVPLLQDDIGLRGMLAVASAAAAIGFCLTLTLPEPAQRSLEDVGDGHGRSSTPTPRVVAGLVPGAVPPGPTVPGDAEARANAG
jgi:MFS family permease